MHILDLSNINVDPNDDNHKDWQWFTKLPIKDPYLNSDAGTMSPLEHGEVVLEDGAEVDLDLGNYERFLDIMLTHNNNITAGKIDQLLPPPSEGAESPRGGDASNPSAGGGRTAGEGDSISFAEAKKLMRLVTVEALKKNLVMEGGEVIGYSHLLKACESMGVVRSQDEAASFARVLDDAGVVLLFRDKVYLYPDKVVDLVRRAVPLALTPEDDPRRDELKKLQEKKKEIDRLAHKQVRRILWSGLGLSVIQVGLFFWLTFWEFSWDVMEPIAFFITATGIVIGYAYFMFTSSDPTYQDLKKRLLFSRQRKLFKKHNFDADRFLELQILSSIKGHAEAELEPHDALRRGC